MTEPEINALVDRAAKRAVAETLMTLGIDASDPVEVQKDFQTLRALRESMATVKKQSLITAVGIVTAGIIGILWMAIFRTPQP